MLKIFHTKVQKKYMKSYVDGNQTEVNYKDVVTLGKSTPGKPKVHLNTMKMQLTTYCLQIETKCISD